MEQSPAPSRPSQSPAPPATRDTEPSLSRRAFVAKAAAGTAAAGAAAAALPVELCAQVAGSDVIKVGVVGLGGRGSGAIVQNLVAADNARLVAVADAFQDKIYGSGPRGSGLPRVLDQLDNLDIEDRADVPPSRQYAGFDAYKGVIDDSDLVVIATPPGFRPIHFEYAVKQGKHVFMEKPVCVDARGFNQVMKSAQEADQKGLKVVVGLQRHYQQVYREAFAKVHEEGMIGEITGAQVWWNGNRPWIIDRQPGWTEMEYQMRNWYHFNWLCGDHIAEQHVHNIDVANWFISGDPVMGGNPVSAQGMGGRAGTEPLSVGELFDHHYVEFRYGDEFGNPVVNSQCRQIQNTFRKVAEEIHGTEGILHLASGRITDRKGEVKWQHRVPRGEEDNPYQVEHDELHAAIRDDTPKNDAYYGAKSSFSSVLGRLATYSGQEVQWDDAVASDFSIMPEEFDFNAEAPVKPDENGDYQIAIPGEWPLPWATEPPSQPQGKGKGKGKGKGA